VSESPSQPEGLVTEQRLRAAFGAVAREVHVEPDADTYRRASAGWRRRYQRRRLVLGVLAAVVFAAADAVGLWALNNAQEPAGVIFSDPGSVPAPGTGRLQWP
jgi:hypothetical protein